jgi:type I restriction-modification system DNA methylase subunit/predicted type IV restriction endonuclease
MPAPQEVIDLIERFERNHDTYRSHEYNETETRREFIDPFFKALGWDIDNQQGYAEAYKDVVHEDAIKIGGVTKAPDYAFRIGGMRKFFVEAKRPGVDIKNDPDPAYQLRRYAWSAKLPLSILTDFEEFAVYDCRMKPNHADKSSVARVLYFTYKEYEARWDEIAAIFSREAILKGSFDKYVESSKKKRGTAEVDDAFLKEIEDWRDLLARNIALRNPDLSTHELNYAVQRTIDRIIFLRICEDRGVESYGQLRGLQNGAHVYPRLCQIFRHADERYNSGLFHFSVEKDRIDLPDDLTLGLTIDDKILKEIFKGLYYPESPFEFSVLPADILGHIYEQFLGKVIRLTPGHHAKVEDKPEVKKAGGVYYTPTYIVDYIVKNTVGKLLDGKTPNQVSKLRILDPACGSGSFLLGAYQHLLNWHQEWYANNDPEKHAKGRSPKVYLGPGSEWRLTTAEKKRILLNNIYGVDIDTQAVEVTKLSLLLKVLEGENAETLGKSIKLFHERALPDLGDNIKCGNSLIGPDFYEGQQLSLLDDEERYRINVLDWNTEYPEIMTAGGFDAVIGNPPYVRMLGVGRQELDHYNNKYKSATGHYDTYVLFVEQGVGLLNAEGLLGMILPNKFFKATYGRGLRCFLNRHGLIEIVDFTDKQLFRKASTYTCLLFVTRPTGASFRYSQIQEDRFPKEALGDLLERQSRSKAFVHSIERPGDSKQWFFLVGEASRIVPDLQERYPPLLSVCERIYQGLATTADRVYIVEQMDRAGNGLISVFSAALGRRILLERKILRPILKGSDVRRYSIRTPQYHCVFPYTLSAGKAHAISAEVMESDYPATLAYLKESRSILDRREHGKMVGRPDWYAYSQEHNLQHFEKPKIISQVLSKRSSLALDDEGDYYFVGGSTAGAQGVILRSGLGISSEYVLGLLNSRLLDYVVRQLSTRFRGGYFNYGKAVIKNLPIRTIDRTSSDDAEKHDYIVGLVNSMLKLHKSLQSARTEHERSLIKRQIDATDKQIDQLVYELYGLTDEEIRIVEEATK